MLRLGLGVKFGVRVRKSEAGVRLILDRVRISVACGMRECAKGLGTE